MTSEDIKHQLIIIIIIIPQNTSSFSERVRLSRTILDLFVLHFDTAFTLGFALR